jgi:type IV pilus assembly protein PilC
MKFNYQARTEDGLVQVGVIEVTSEEEAVSLLQKDGLYVTHLEEVELKPFYFQEIKFFKKAGRKDTMMFCRQLSLMLKSGVGLVESLKALALQATRSHFREQILKIAVDVEGGLYFSEALAKFPKVFSNFFINIIKSGEASGKLSESLTYLARHLEREYNLISKIRSGMTYPAFILLTFLGIGAFGVFIVLPSFHRTLETFEIELPFFSNLIFSLADAFQEWWWVIFLTLLIFIIFLWRYFKTEEGKEILGRFSLKIPVIGLVIKKTQLARLTENLSTLILSGLPITQALEIVSGITGNKVYQQIVLEAQEGVRRGENMSAILEKHPKYIPGLVTQMMRVGERTGRLDESLMNVADFYQTEINRRIDSLISIIEPVLIIVLGGLIALLMISVVVPLYKGMSSFGF